MSMQKSESQSSWLTYTDAIAEQSHNLLILLARVLLGWIFVMSGWGKLMNISGFAATMPRRGLRNSWAISRLSLSSLAVCC